VHDDASDGHFLLAQRCLGLGQRSQHPAVVLERHGRDDSDAGGSGDHGEGVRAWR